jgi:two-component system LytT family response regulator
MDKKRTIIHSIDKIDVIKHDDLVYISSSGKYSTFVTSDNRKIISSSNIGNHLSNLSEDQFIRLHNSFIVNIDYILFIQKGENWKVILTDQTEIPVSRRKREELIQKLEI